MREIPVEDPAWCVRIIRMHHPEYVAALSSFFDTYGGRPPWPARQQAMVEVCRALLALSEWRQPRGETALRQNLINLSEQRTCLVAVEAAETATSAACLSNADQRERGQP